jgi:2-(1,2-epoxy-1,2-dihydrophenyl)acetyl-CoA isomerase
MSEHVQLTKSDGVARIIINRPDVKNAMSVAMGKVLIDHVRSLADDGDIRVVVLEGRGADFTSGGDLSDMGSILKQGGSEREAVFRQSAADIAKPLMDAFQALQQPIVASVRGYAIGVGLQLVLLADLVVASETARFVAPQVRLAHTLDHGETVFLPRKVGMARALQMTLLGEVCTAEAAERYGLVNWVVADADLESATDRVINQLLGGAPLALRENKALLYGSLTRSVEDQLIEESVVVGRCAATADFDEALLAFSEKRKPQFVGR